MNNMSTVRELIVNMRRNANADCDKNGLEMKGFSFYWPDGTTINTGLASFCEKGMQLFFGKGVEIPEQCKIKLLCRDAEQKEPLWWPMPGIRGRRMYLQREGTQGVLYFHNGNRTELTFDEAVEEPPVLDWIGLSRLQEGVRWLDIAAVPMQEEPLGSNLITAA